jgi:hypothetical protein
MGNGALKKAGRMIYLTASGQVSAEPCILYAIILSVNTTTDYLTLYDGQDDGGTVVALIKGITSFGHNYSIPGGARFGRGLYATLSASGMHVTFVILPVREGNE